jgi:cytochrome P450
LRESLRVTPSIGEFAVTCDKDEIIGDGKYLIKKGSVVILLVKAIGSDPTVWGENVSRVSVAFAIFS